MKGGKATASGRLKKSCWSEFLEDWEKKAAALGRVCSLCAKVGQRESEAKEGQ